MGGNEVADMGEDRGSGTTFASSNSIIFNLIFSPKLGRHQYGRIPSDAYNSTLAGALFDFKLRPAFPCALSAPLTSRLILFFPRSEPDFGLPRSLLLLSLRKSVL
jgi:hypothetical protein